MKHDSKMRSSPPQALSVPLVVTCIGGVHCHLYIHRSSSRLPAPLVVTCAMSVVMCARPAAAAAAVAAVSPTPPHSRHSRTSSRPAYTDGIVTNMDVRQLGLTFFIQEFL